MAFNVDNTSQESKANQEVKNETADETVKEGEAITDKRNDKAPDERSPTTSNTMPDDKKADESDKPKARFRKGNIFINAEQANTFFNKKK